MFAKRIVIDTDADNQVDDQFALAYALLSPELKVDAVYAAPFVRERAATPEEGMRKSHIEIGNVQMAVGKSATTFEGSTRFLGQLERSPAALDLTMRETVGVVAMGPLTNVASALLIDSTLHRRIEVVWIGGPAGEFNWDSDADAMRVIRVCRAPFTRIPCIESMGAVEVTQEIIDREVKGQGALGDFLHQRFTERVNGPKKLWDMAAVARMVNPEWVPVEHGVATSINGPDIWEDFIGKLHSPQAASVPDVLAGGL